MEVKLDLCLNQQPKKLFCDVHRDPIRLSKVKEIFLMIPFYKELKQALTGLLFNSHSLQQLFQNDPSL